MITVQLADACARARLAIAKQEERPYDEILYEPLADVEAAVGIQQQVEGQRAYDDAVKAVSRAFRVPVGCIIGRRRTRRYARARHALTCLLHSLGFSQIEIAEQMHRCASSVCKSVREGQRLLDADDRWAADFRYARDQLAVKALEVAA